MSSDHKILEKIDLYTRGGMTEEERAEFEKALEADPHLHRQMELSMMVDQMVVAKEALALKAQMRKDLYKPKNAWGKYIGFGLLLITVSAGVLYLANSPTQEGSKPKSSAQATVSKAPKKPEPSTIGTTKKPNENNIGLRPASKVKEQTQETLAQTQSVPKVASQPSQTLMPKPDRTTPPKDEEAPKEHSNSLKQVDHCAGLQPFVEYSVVPSCKGEPTGEVSINVSTAVGGTAPYRFVLAGKEASDHFYQLPSGSYALQIMDARNCMVENKQTIFVPEKVCKVAKEYIFNVEYDHFWHIPYDPEKTPSSFKIVDKSGKLFYHSTVVGGNPEEWRGESNTGLELTTGLYFFTIEYADKSIDESPITIIK